MEFIPGHSGIEGNDIEDHLSKSETNKKHKGKLCSMRGGKHFIIAKEHFQRRIAA